MSKEEAEKGHWYIKINKRESGPYQYKELLLMVHNNDIKGDDQITCRGLGDWKKISEFKLLSQQSLKDYFAEADLDPEDLDTIHFRKSMRVDFKELVLVVSGNQLFQAICLDLSTGGCMVKVRRGKILYRQSY